MGDNQFEPDKTAGGNADDEWAAFEAECARRLKEEHERREKKRLAAERAKAAEKAPEPEPAPEPDPAPEPEPAREPEPVPEPEPASEPEPEPEPERTPSEELAAIMRAESNESLIHRSRTAVSDDADESGEKDEYFSDWLRILFTVLLLFLGGAGIYVMLGMNYHSYIFDPLCFVEVSVCLLTAVGLNVSLIPLRISKEVIMRLAAYALFAFYLIYAADALFLRKLLATGIDKSNVMTYAKSHISADVVGGLSAMGREEMLSCAIMAAPFAFFLLILIKPFRNPMLYLLTMMFSFFAVGTMRILCMSGTFNLSQGCMALAGTGVAYIVFFFPPLRNLLTDVGLITWDYDEDDDD